MHCEANGILCCSSRETKLECKERRFYCYAIATSTVGVPGTVKLFVPNVKATLRWSPSVWSIFVRKGAGKRHTGFAWHISLLPRPLSQHSSEKLDSLIKECQRFSSHFHTKEAGGIGRESSDQGRTNASKQSPKPFCFNQLRIHIHQSSVGTFGG